MNTIHIMDLHLVHIMDLHFQPSSTISREVMNETNEMRISTVSKRGVALYIK